MQSHKHRFLNIENPEICSAITTRLVDLGEENNSYIMIKQSRLQDHLSDWAIHFECTFRVGYESSSFEGVFAVIQRLNLRRNKLTKQCIDYVEFFSKDGLSRSNKFCGRINASSAMTNTDHILDNINYSNAFRTRKHKMYVHIFVNKAQTLNSDEEAELEIIFTAYKNCTKTKSSDDLYLPCSKHSQFCIYKEFFNDSLVNCPFAGCVDEGVCSKLKYVTNPSVSTKLLVSSISFLFILFMCFLICIWACKKHKVVCFSEEFSNAPPRRANCPRYEMNQQTGARLAQETEAVSSQNTEPADLSKDLPPSYDALFPDR